ncbi:HET-domain-containing protein [Pleurostoma richardsiae]|uniref:HET-domain-containing protein n=1 Tax=Pleurostoma richardsiae TaxID=41990 RepID=A0AA38VWN2_9PEZI|nr:HET-domain-containing protein [Pleurostoma richardsiae]
MSVYQPLPLDAASSQIRMLEILPSRRASSIIRCRLLCVDLAHLNGDDVPFEFYEALSYTWGDGSVRVTIKLNGRRTVVTQNLEAALRRLRARDFSRYLWVDALCINQEDVNERNSQVMKMCDIYRHAEQVILWLGAEANGSTEAMRLVMQIGEEDVSDSWIRSSMESDVDLDKWEAVAKFFDRPYWRRLWVRQEIALAKDIIVICGDYAAAWDDLLVGASSLEVHSDLFDEIAAGVSLYVSGYRRAVAIQAMRERIQEGGADLQDVLFHLRECECIDPRDKVYGGLGMCNEPGIVVNYALSAAEVFTDTTVAVIKHTRALDILSACRGHGSRNLLGLPTWVPDFESDWTAQKLRHLEGDEQLDSAGGTLPPFYAFNRLQSGRLSLTVRGIAAARVFDACWAYGDSKAPPPSEVLEQWRITAETTLKSAVPTLSHGEIRETFWRTIIADEDMNGQRPPDSFLEQTADLVTEDSGHVIPRIHLETGDSTFRMRFLSASASRAFFATQDKRIGLGPQGTKRGDWVVVLFGAAQPYVLRRERDHFIMIGEAYVHGIMNGEVTELLELGSVQTEDFELY